MTLTNRMAMWREIRHAKKTWSNRNKSRQGAKAYFRAIKKIKDKYGYDGWYL